MAFSDGFNKWLAAQGKEPCDPELSRVLDEAFAQTVASIRANPSPIIDGACQLMEALVDARNGDPTKLRALVKEAQQLRAARAGKEVTDAVYLNDKGS